MKNTDTDGGLNAFTEALLVNTKAFVRLRNGNIVQGPVVFLGEDDWEDDFNKPRGFQDGTWSYCWKLDGISVTTPDFDMMEIIN